MLQYIRKGIGSWFTKVFLGLIILSFAVWGVGDILRGPRDRTVLSVGGLDIPISQFQNELRRVQAQLGPNVDMEQARQFGIVEITARRLIERGVRFVQLYHGGWDHHGGNGDENLVTNLPERCRQTDRGGGPTSMKRS